MSKFSPGPWNIRPLRSKFYGTEIEIGRGLVNVWLPMDSGEYVLSPRELENGETPEEVEWSHAESERNYYTARLIASAPELYEALKSIFDADMTYIDGIAQGITYEQAQIARAALAKAEGK